MKFESYWQQFYQILQLLSFNEQAITDDGEDPNEYVFESDEKPKTPVKRARNESRSSNTNEAQVNNLTCKIHIFNIFECVSSVPPFFSCIDKWR